MSRELARLGGSGGHHGSRHRAGVALVVLLGVAAVAGIVAVDDALGEVAGEGEPAATTVATTAPAARDHRPVVIEERAPAGAGREPATAAPAPAPPPLEPLGTVDGLTLHVPAVDPVLVSYHEASQSEAVAIAPSGAVSANENPTRAYDRGGADGPAYHVQVSRGRRQLQQEISLQGMRNATQMAKTTTNST